MKMDKNAYKKLKCIQISINQENHLIKINNVST